MNINPQKTRRQQLNNKLEQALVSSDLPVAAARSSVKKALAGNFQIILEAEPGAGKTTIVPLILLQQLLAKPCPSGDKILVLEPRRLAARNAAMRMAELLAEPCGETVGYRIRQQSKVGRNTKIEVVTEGILGRMIQTDPELSGYAAIIFDEFHERSIYSDLGLAFALDSQQVLREDLLLVVMSATLAIKELKDLLTDASHLKVEGRSYPVDVRHITPPKNWDWRAVVIRTTRQALKESDGDILIFVAGVSEINWLQRQFDQELQSDETDTADTEKLAILALHGSLSFTEQKKAIVPTAGVRKIIIATNIAESSLTIDGVTAVIDSGMFRSAEFDPNAGFNMLHSRRISKAQAMQRAGRAGRLQAGICYRLWPESEPMREQAKAEIERIDLCPMVLEIKNWGASDVSDLALITQPPRGHWQQAVDLLQELDLISDEQKINDPGKRAIQFPIHPRYSRMLLRSENGPQLELACWLIALLEERDIWQGEKAKDPDFELRFRALADNHGTFFNSVHKEANKLFNIDKVCNRRASVSTNYGGIRPVSKLLECNDWQFDLRQLIFWAFPERLAMGQGNSYQLASGQRANIAEQANVEQFLLAVKLGGIKTRPKIFWALSLTIDEMKSLTDGRTETDEVVIWDSKLERVIAERRIFYGKILLQSVPSQKIPAAKISQCLLSEILAKGLSQLPWRQEDIQLLKRVQLVRELSDDEISLPAMDWESLTASAEIWLLPFLDNCRKMSDLNDKLLGQALHALLDWNQKSLLDKMAPTTWIAPSGRVVPLAYKNDLQTIVAIKLQEVFGLDQQPKIANGQHNLTFHLLSPAGRPIQITQDIANFWHNSYPEVKKEMKGRYPKHPWPDDPVSAAPTALTKRALANKNRA